MNPSADSIALRINAEAVLRAQENPVELYAFPSLIVHRSARCL